MKKWLPFVILLIVIVTSLAYIFLSKEDSTYIPETDDAAIIYREACRNCHGDKGQGSGLFYPSLDEELHKAEIYNTIQNGSLLMPAFIHIKGDTLDRLVEFIESKSFEK